MGDFVVNNVSHKKYIVRFWDICWEEIAMLMLISESFLNLLRNFIINTWQISYWSSNQFLCSSFIFQMVLFLFLHYRHHLKIFIVFNLWVVFSSCVPSGPNITPARQTIVNPLLGGPFSCNHKWLLKASFISWVWQIFWSLIKFIDLHVYVRR